MHNCCVRHTWLFFFILNLFFIDLFCFFAHASSFWILLQIERLQALLCDKEIYKINFLNFDSLPLPLDPSVKVKAVIPEKATLFKSALMPARLTFLTVENKEYVTIFKLGDDLRQDQLILQTISLMDKVCSLWKKYRFIIVIKIIIFIFVHVPLLSTC